MTDTPQEMGDKTLVATFSTGSVEQRIYMPKKGVDEFFSDGVAGLLVSGSVAKLDFYSSEVDYSPNTRENANIEHRLVHHRGVIPLNNLLDFFAGFLRSVEFQPIDNANGDLNTRLKAIAAAAQSKVKSDE